LLLPQPETRHFDRSSSRLCERRSGEIRFSTSASSQALSAFAVACSPSPFHKKPVISTEAAHAFVSCAAEKSAVLPLTTEPRSLVKAPTAEGPIYHFIQRGFSR
jgi:hypothetical protein